MCILWAFSERTNASSEGIVQVRKALLSLICAGEPRRRINPSQRSTKQTNAGRQDGRGDEERDACGRCGRCGRRARRPRGGRQAVRDQEVERRGALVLGCVARSLLLWLSWLVWRWFGEILGLNELLSGQTSWWTTAPSAATTSWTCASSARPTRRRPRARSARWPGASAVRSRCTRMAVSAFRTLTRAFVWPDRPRVPLPLHLAMAQDAAGVPAGQPRVGVPEVRQISTHRTHPARPGGDERGARAAARRTLHQWVTVWRIDRQGEGNKRRGPSGEGLHVWALRGGGCRPARESLISLWLAWFLLVRWRPKAQDPPRAPLHCVPSVS